MCLFVKRLNLHPICLKKPRTSPNQRFISDLWVFTTYSLRKNTRKRPKMTEKNTEQTNIEDQQQQQFDDIIQDGLVNGGIHINASKGHGKSRLLFSIAQYLQSLPNCRLFIFDGSEAWLYGYSKIATFNINECDIQLLTDNKTTEDLERYSLNNWNLIKLALQTEKDILFRLKSRKPSKRGFAVRTIINYLDALQRQEREQSATHEPKNNLCYIIEEAQDCFNIRSTQRIDSEEFLTVFNESRNNKESFFTASQRLNDFSKTIRTKQNYVLGKINPEDKTPALKQIERQCNNDLSKMPLRTWLFNGETFVSPNWIQQGKPFIINRQLRAKFNSETQTQQKQYPNIIKASLIAYFGLTSWYKNKHPELYANQQQTQKTETESEDLEDSQGDGLMTLEDGEELFPEET